MDHDDARALDGSRNVRKQADDGPLQHLPEEDECGHQEPANCRSIDESQVSDAEFAQKVIEAIPRETLVEALEIIGLEQTSTQWSGILPDPDSFKQYPPDVQKAMVAWNDAQIIDASKRLDKFADAAIKNVRLETVLTFILNFGFASGSFAAFIITGNLWSYGLLAIPGITIAVNLISNRRKRKAIENEPPLE